MPTPTRGFGGRILYVPEDEEGVTPTDPAFIKLSDHVQDVELAIDPNFEEYRDIGSYDPRSFFDGLHEYRLKVTFLLHEDRAELVTNAIEREADDGLIPHTFEVATGLNGASPGFFTLRGLKAADVKVSTEVGRPVELEVTFQGLEADIAAIEPDIGVGTRETADLGAVCQFRTSSIERGGAPVAFVTRSVELSVSHNLDIDGTDGQDGPRAIEPGKRDTSGSVDISIDDGGVALANAVRNGDEADIVLNLGGSGAPRIIAVAARFEDFVATLNTEDGFLKRDVPFRAKGATVGTV